MDPSHTDSTTPRVSRRREDSSGRGGNLVLHEYPHARRDDRELRTPDDLVQGEGDVDQAGVVQHDVHDLEKADCSDAAPLLPDGGLVEGAEGGQGHDRVTRMQNPMARWDMPSGRWGT